MSGRPRAPAKGAAGSSGHGGGDGFDDRFLAEDGDVFRGVDAVARDFVGELAGVAEFLLQADEFDLQSSDHGGLGRIAKLRDSGFEFVLIGGCTAVTFGAAQVTRDLDICVVLTGENVELLRRALAERNPAVA